MCSREKTAKSVDAVPPAGMGLAALNEDQRRGQQLDQERARHACSAGIMNGGSTEKLSGS